MERVDKINVKKQWHWLRCKVAVRTRMRKNWQEIWDKYHKVCLMQIVYMLVTWSIISPFLSWILKKLLQLNGYSYITTEMIIPFLMHPLVILFLCSIIFLLSALVAAVQIFTYESVYRYITYKENSIYANCWYTLKVLHGIMEQKRWEEIFSIAANMIYQNIFVFLIFGACDPRISYLFTTLRKVKYGKDVFGLVLLFIILYGFVHAFTYAEHTWKGKWTLPGGERRKGIYLVSKNWLLVLSGWLYRNFWNVLFFLVLYSVLAWTSIGVITLWIQPQLRIAVFAAVEIHLYWVAFLCTLCGGMTSQINGVLKEFQLCDKRCCGWKQDKTNKLWIQQSSRWNRKCMILAIVLVLCTDVYVVYDTLRNGGNSVIEHFGETEVTAHRGASYGAPENTLPAMKKAIKEQADFIELDVQETQDGVVVLMHDSTMKRTVGLRKRIYQCTYAELSDLDAGAWYGKQYENTPIPTLEQVLTLCKGKCRLNIEIKSNKYTPDLERHVVELVEKYGFERQCVITSVYKSSLRKVKKFNAKIQTGYILSSAYGRYYLDDEIDFLSMRSELVTETIVRLAHIHGKEVHVWTVNNKKDAIWLSQLAVDNIITDRPAYVKQIVNEKKKGTSFFGLLSYIW